MPLPENEVREGETVIEISQETGVLVGIALDQLQFIRRMSGATSQINHSMLKLVDMFGDFLEKQKFLLDKSKEKTDAKDKSGAVKQRVSRKKTYTYLAHRIQQSIPKLLTCPDL